MHKRVISVEGGESHGRFIHKGYICGSSLGHKARFQGSRQGREWGMEWLMEGFLEKLGHIFHREES